MESWEYLQLTINYYPIEEEITGLTDTEDSDVWKGLLSYLDILNQQGWIMMNETKSDKGRLRTYQLRKAVKHNSKQN